jgi:DNA end-binding protein Ku
VASTVWRGYLTFGLISIPIRLFRAARAERVSFKRVYRASPAPEPEAEPEDEIDVAESGPPKATSRPGPVLLPDLRYEPIQQAAVRRNTDEVVESVSVKKGYEVEKGRYIVIEPEELKQIAPKTATEMEIAEFVRLSEIDPVYFETSYYVRPEQAGEKAYALLYRALQEAGLVAVAQMAMHSREHVMVVRPGKQGLVAHTMYYQNEVRADEEFRADVSAVSPKELQLAHQLVESLAAQFEPTKYRDTYREKIEAIIEQKRAGRFYDSKPMPPAVPNSVVDITAALQKSLAALKKAPQKAVKKVKAKPASAS